jgi:hypothetical protein
VSGDLSSGKSLSAVVLLASQGLSHESEAAAGGGGLQDVSVAAWLACVHVYLDAGT